MTGAWLWCLGVAEPNHGAPGVKRAWLWCLRGDRESLAMAILGVERVWPCYWSVGCYPLCLSPLPRTVLVYPVLMELMDLWH